jgi:hypothetical protein
MSLHDLIAATFGLEAAEAWQSLSLSEDDVQRLRNVALNHRFNGSCF